MWPRCRSGAVGSKPTLTTSGRPVAADRSSFEPELGGADHVHAALGEIGELFVDSHGGSGWLVCRARSSARSGSADSRRRAARDLSAAGHAAYYDACVPADVRRSGAATCSRGSPPSASAPPTGAAAHGFLYERHHVDVTRDDAARRRAAGRARRAAHRVPHRPPPQRHRVARAHRTRRSSLLMAEQPDLIVLGGDYVTWGDSGEATGTSSSRPPSLAALSAPHGVFAVLGNHDDDRDMPAALAARGHRGPARRAHAADDPRRAARPRRHPLLDARGRGHRARSRAARRQRRSCSPTPRRGWPRRGAACRSCSAATPTAARSCCPGSAPSPRGASRSSPARAPREHRGLRQPRRRHGLRPRFA